MKVPVEDAISLIEDFAQFARTQVKALPGMVDCDAETKAALEAEVAALLTKADEVILQRLAELRGVAGHE